jgi:hypothetical protein
MTKHINRMAVVASVLLGKAAGLAQSEAPP